jgi:hypothetical protein
LLELIVRNVVQAYVLSIRFANNSHGFLLSPSLGFTRGCRFPLVLSLPGDVGVKSIFPSRTNELCCVAQR